MPRTVLILARPYDAELMRRALSEAGCVASALDLRADLSERVEEEFPRAVVLALRRPEVEAAPQLKKLRLGEYGKYVPVILVSEPGSAVRTLAHALELGANQLLLRPLDLSQVVSAVRVALGVSETRQAGGTGPLASAEPTPQAAASEPVPAAQGEPGSAAGPRQFPGATVLTAGDLRSVDVPHLLWQAKTAGFTGSLFLLQGEVRKTIVFDGGDPVFAASNQAEDHLGDLLYREGKITREQYLTGQDLAVQTGRRLGAVLVDRGYVKPRELLSVVRRQVAEIVYSVFSWSEGSFELHPGAPSPEETIRLEARSEALILEGIRRRYGLDRLVELLGPEEVTVLSRAMETGTLEQAGLNETERGLLALMDGHRTLREIVAQSLLPGLQVYQVAYAATVLGWAGVLGVGQLKLLGGETTAVAERREQDIDRQRIEAKYARVCRGDYFSVLGLTTDATAHEVLRAYEQARHEFSADAFSDPVAHDYQEHLAEIREVVEEAYRVLGDDELREAYRESIR